MSVDPYLKVQNYHNTFFYSATDASAAAAQPAPAAHAPQAKSTDDKKRAAEAKKDKAPTEEEDKLTLTNAVMGKVVTRFPPEASGFIHIGHSKAALVNSMLAQKYQGKLLFRFDDTNVEKEKPEFEKAIMDDLHQMGVSWDIGPTYSSDYFGLMMEMAEKLIKEGKAYCDDTDIEEMRKQRFDGVESKNRNNTVEANMAMWEEMKKGTEKGQRCCLRAKISMEVENKALRDPTLYRCNLNPHPRTGDRFKVYPTYDFCCPIVDSVEGVTHAIRTNEYHDRNAQYEWIARALNLRVPQVEDFSRLNMEYSLMSKRKLTKCVNEGIVDGWDDPRMPTFRALMRRGLRVDALREFVKVQGMSKVVNWMEWSKLWNFNVQILDPSVPRYTVVANDLRVRCVVEGQAHLAPAKRARHKKNPSLGEKQFFYSDVVFLDAEDVLLLAEGEEVTLMDWGNCFIRHIAKNDAGIPISATLVLNPQGDVKKTKYKLTWVPENPNAPVIELREYEHLLTKKKPDPEEDIDGLLAKHTLFTQLAYGEEAIRELKPGDSLQLERRGYYIVDTKPNPQNRMVLIYIPDGRDKLNHLSAKAQFLKLHPELAPVAATATKEAAGGNKALEEKRAAKAAKKAASGTKTEPAK